MYPEVQKVQQELEGKFISQQAEIEAKAKQLYAESPDKAIAFLTAYSTEEAQFAFDRWKKLGEFLTIKYMDGVVRKEKDGQFIRNEHGGPSSPQRVGYPQNYYDKVAKETGDKYKIH